MNTLSDYDFILPKELIATAPAARGCSRLLALPKNATSPIHDTFANIGAFLRDGDVLVVNNTKVMKARLYGHKKTGSKIEILLVRPLAHGSWAVLLDGKGYLVGKTIVLNNQHELEVIQKIESEPGLYEIKSSVDLQSYAESNGELPIPKYFGRKPDAADDSSYQTVFAKEHGWGGVAAPTAGLHFTPELIATLSARGIHIHETTLHVGPGTFLPVRTEDIRNHKMHSEYFELNQATAAALNQARAQQRRIVVVGTTAMRVVEQSMQWAKERGENYFSATTGSTAIFIRPGYQFLGCDALITNFHVPRSTLLMLVSAVVGRSRILKIYEEAIAQNYRFFSYGDACYFEIRNDVND